jgi:hypothetical protein
MELSQTNLRLLEIRPAKTTRVTIKHRNGELSQQGKMYFCRMVCRCTGTARVRSRHLVLLFILDAVGLAPLFRLVEIGCTISLRLANVLILAQEWS